ncbi:MAG: hypothetical protein C0456_18615, partial [Hyphomonas sp.]|uniref:hypothetical protein n=1 Tax=Hyphomonas sp. TaxID=87 RepID=UPI001DEB0C43
MAAAGMFDRALLAPAARDAFVKLDPRTLMRNPVMFTTAVVAAAATLIFLYHLSMGRYCNLTSGNSFEAGAMRLCWGEPQQRRSNLVFH